MTGPSAVRQFVIRGAGSRLTLSGEDISELTGTRRETINRTLWGVRDVLLFWWNALDLVDFLDILLDALLVIHDADAPIHLPRDAIALATPEKEICRRRDHKRGVRGTAGQAPAGCECEVVLSPGIQPAKA
jgi:hypothetical protein